MYHCSRLIPGKISCATGSNNVEPSTRNPTIIGTRPSLILWQSPGTSTPPRRSLPRQGSGASRRRRRASSSAAGTGSRRRRRSRPARRRCRPRRRWWGRRVVSVGRHLQRFCHSVTFLLGRAVTGVRGFVNKSLRVTLACLGSREAASLQCSMWIHEMPRIAKFAFSQN